jgi:hypothetical protein
MIPVVGLVGFLDILQLFYIVRPKIGRQLEVTIINSVIR